MEVISHQQKVNDRAEILMKEALTDQKSFQTLEDDYEIVTGCLQEIRLALKFVKPFSIAYKSDKVIVYNCMQTIKKNMERIVMQIAEKQIDREERDGN